MRIFLSYGHDSNEVLVRRIKHDLELRKHDVWFDQSKIKAGQDWRRAITEGIKDSDGVLSFLSKHSVRDPGVCLDEIGIAVGVKGGNIQTILVESETEVKPPPTVTHIQWLDMRDWKSRHESGGDDWVKWYAEKFAEIVAVLESDTTRRFAGEIQQLQQLLRPISSDPRILELIGKPFVGREWVLSALESWRLNTDRSTRIFWITGGPGAGKSAFAAHLTHYGRDKVIAGVFCEYDKPDHRDPKHIFRSISFQIATRLPDYRTFLLKLLVEDRYELDRKSANELFDDLLVKPLQHAIDGGRQRYVIILDGLDEASDGSRNELASMLARHLPRLPEWIGIVATSRPVSAVLTPLRGLRPFVIEATSEANQSDLSKYLQLQLWPQLSGRTDADRILKQILTRSNGVFLYAEQFCREVHNGHISLNQPDSFPEGLGGIYEQFFERQFPNVADYDRDIRPFLTLIVARRGPLPLVVLGNMLEATDFEVRRRLEWVGSLFVVNVQGGADTRVATVAPFHKSLDDWLTGVDPTAGINVAGCWAVDRIEGERRFARFGLESFRSEGDVASYFCSHLIEHLIAADRAGDAAALLTDLPWLETNVKAGRTFLLSTDFAATIQRVKDVEVESVLMLIDEAVRSDLHFIASNYSEYPQGLLQTVVNYLSPLIAVTNLLAIGVIDKLRLLMEKWKSTTTAKERAWLKIDWLDRERTYLGPFKWQSQMRERTPHWIAVSPSGEFIAAAAKINPAKLQNRPLPWPEFYSITVWSAKRGEVIAHLFPDRDSVDASGPPEDLPRPAECDERFRSYFEYIRKKRETPPPDPVYDFSKGPPNIPYPPPDYLNVGKYWQDSLFAGEVHSLEWSDDSTLMAGCRGGRLFGWDAISGRQVISYQESNVDPDGQIRDWNDVTVNTLVRLNADRLAIGTSLGEIQVVKMPAESSNLIQPVNSCTATSGQVYSLAYDANTNQIAVGTRRQIKILDAETLQILKELDGHGDSVTGVAWSPNGKLLASVGWDRKLRVWDVASGNEVWEAVEHPSDFIRVTWSSDERVLFTTWNLNGIGGRLDGTVKAWNADTGTHILDLGVSPYMIESFAIDGGTRRLFTGGRDGGVRCFSLDGSGERISPAVCHKTHIRDAAFSRQLQLIATMSLDGVATWSAVDGHRVSFLKRDWSDYVNWDKHVLFSYDGKYLAAIIGDSIHMLHPDSLAPIWVKSAKANVYSCRFSSDLRFLVTDDGKAPNTEWVDKGTGSIAWDVATGEIVCRSGASGLEAAEWVREQEAANTRRVHDTDEQLTKFPLSSWKSSHFVDTKKHFTVLQYETTESEWFQLRLPTAIRNRFQLDDTCQWILVLEGATAPVRAIVELLDGNE
jgi:WD40 repeat protein